MQARPDTGRRCFPEKKRGMDMMNFIAVICVFVGGYGVRWLCEVMQEVK